MRLNNDFRLPLDIERVSKQLGIDYHKFLGVYQYEERLENGNLQVREKKEGDNVLEEKAGPSDQL